MHSARGPYLPPLCASVAYTPPLTPPPHPSCFLSTYCADTLLAARPLPHRLIAEPASPLPPPPSGPPCIPATERHDRGCVYGHVPLPGPTVVPILTDLIVWVREFRREIESASPRYLVKKKPCCETDLMRRKAAIELWTNEMIKRFNRRIDTFKIAVMESDFTNTLEEGQKHKRFKPTFKAHRDIFKSIETATRELQAGSFNAIRKIAIASHGRATPFDEICSDIRRFCATQRYRIVVARNRQKGTLWGKFVAHIYNDELDENMRVRVLPEIRMIDPGVEMMVTHSGIP